jgi:hypothetical protein
VPYLVDDLGEESGNNEHEHEVGKTSAPTPWTNRPEQECKVQLLAPHLMDDLGEESHHDEHEGDEIEEEVEPVQAEHAARV